MFSAACETIYQSVAGPESLAAASIVIPFDHGAAFQYDQVFQYDPGRPAASQASEDSLNRQKPAGAPVSDERCA